MGLICLAWPRAFLERWTCLPFTSSRSHAVDSAMTRAGRGLALSECSGPVDRFNSKNGARFSACDARLGSTSDVRRIVTWLVTLVNLSGEPSQLFWQ